MKLKSIFSQLSKKGSNSNACEILTNVLGYNVQKFNYDEEFNNKSIPTSFKKLKEKGYNLTNQWTINFNFNGITFWIFKGQNEEKDKYVLVSNKNRMIFVCEPNDDILEVIWNTEADCFWSLCLMAVDAVDD